MKHKFRIAENHYSDNTIRYFPQIGDWWHGWQYYTFNDGLYPASIKAISFDSLEEATNYIRKQKDFWEQGFKPKPRKPRYLMKTIVHKL